LIANYAIKPYIPRIWRNFLDFLTLKRNADEFRTNPVFAMPQKGKTPIEIATAHADPMSVFIERDRRCNDQVEFSRRYQDPANGFPYTVSVLLEFSFRRCFAKEHFALGAQNRNKNALVCAPRGFDDVTCVDFVDHRQVTTDRVACIKLSGRDHSFTDNTGSCFALWAGHIASGA